MKCAVRCRSGWRRRSLPKRSLMPLVNSTDGRQQHEQRTDYSPLCRVRLRRGTGARLPARTAGGHDEMGARPRQGRQIRAEGRMLMLAYASQIKLAEMWCRWWLPRQAEIID